MDGCTIGWNEEELDPVGLQFLVSPAIARHEGYRMRCAGPYSRQEDSLKPGLEYDAVHPRVLLGEVR